jgi:hypothetical protein
MIVVQWGMIESFLCAMVPGLTEEKSEEREKFFSTWSGSARIDQIEYLVSSKLLSPWRDEILALIKEIRQLQDLRDKIVHGQWGGGTNKPHDGGEAELSNWNKPYPEFRWKLKFGGLRELSYRIDAVHYSFVQFMIQNRTLYASGTFYSLGDALKSRCKSQDRS